MMVIILKQVISIFTKSDKQMFAWPKVPSLKNKRKKETDLIKVVNTMELLKREVTKMEPTLESKVTLQFFSCKQRGVVTLFLLSIWLLGLKMS
jgi:hypothetical protein